MIKVGIPRALLYYEYYPMWKTFFEELGAEIVVSPPTTRVILAEGSARVIADTCLPVKVFIGHVLSLVDKCDFIFIPAIRSVKNRVYNCSKFLGLPDMTRAVIPKSPDILDIEIDVNKGTSALYRAIYRLGRNFTWNPWEVRRASLAASQVYRDYRQMMSGLGLTPTEAIERISSPGGIESGEPANQPTSAPATIALIGHPYLLYDEHINHRIIHRLEQGGNKIVTPEMLTTGQLDAAIVRLVGKAYWTYEEEVVGAGGHYLQNGINGVIGIMAFGCGPDSVMMDMVHRQSARLRTTPFMNLTLEEHTAEAGVVTRLEAFTDMIDRRRRQAEVCA